MLGTERFFVVWFGCFGALTLTLVGCGQPTPTPPPVVSPKRPAPEQTEFCLPDVTGGVLIASKERAESLGCLRDEDITKTDFSKQAVGLFRKTVACNGTATVEDQVVYWTEFGVCGAGDETVLDFVAYFDQGLTFSDKKVPFESRQEARELAMSKVAKYARSDDTLLQFRRAIDPTALTWSLRQGDKTQGWELAIDDVTIEKVKETLLYRRAIADFDCSQPPTDGQFVCTKKGADYAANYTVKVKGSRFQLSVLDERMMTP